LIIASMMLAVVSGVALSVQDKYTLKLPNGLAFSDFKGYGDWQLISSAETDDRIKVILGNPTIIAALKSGIPGNGKPFPEASKIAKVQWKPKKSTEAQFSVRSARDTCFRLPQRDRAGERALAGSPRGPVRSAARFLLLRT
jgi:hypothetical protein